MIPLFDLHADTLYEIYKSKELLSNNSLHISLEKAKIFKPYIQVMAIWSDKRLSNNEAYNNFFRVLDYAHSLKLNFETKKEALDVNALILAVEDARLLNGEIKRLDELFRCGVRVLTLNWQGVSTIGGAWDTENGLSQFGKDVVLSSFSLGITPDISHSSIKSAYQVIEIANEQKKPIIASHSNSFSIYNHKRNLTDELFLEIKSLGGLVGISLAGEHLDNNATIRSVLNHIFHYLSLGGENTICLGCDFDGVSSLPNGILEISDLNLLYSLLKDELGQEITNKIFYQNAHNFFIKVFH